MKFCPVNISAFRIHYFGFLVDSDKFKRFQCTAWLKSVLTVDIADKSLQMACILFYKIKKDCFVFLKDFQLFCSNFCLFTCVCYHSILNFSSLPFYGKSIILLDTVTQTKSSFERAKLSYW